MNTRRGILCFLACGMALLLTGCIWLRLLSLKNQLAEFDRYVRLDNREGLAFEFVTPVLYAKDVRALLEFDPTSRTTNGNQQTWSWTFEKIPATNTEPKIFDLTFKTGFVNDKLSRFAIPDRFLAFVPKESVVGMARALGNAKVDRKQRSATAQWRSDEPQTDTKRLSRAELRELLGPPLRVQDAKEGSTFFYEYRLKSPSLQKNQSLTARAKCLFSARTDQLSRVEIRYIDLHLNMSFDSPK